MKTNFKKALVPLAVMVFGAAAAFATNAAKQSEKVSTVYDGYHYDSTKPPGQQCSMVEVQCTDALGPICTDLVGNQLWGSNDNGLSCPVRLSFIN